MKATIILFIMAVVRVCPAIGHSTISFETPKETDDARLLLEAKCLEGFMIEVWKQGVAAPGIHSKYWVDRFTQGQPELSALETARRDFGLALLKQVDRFAVEIFRHPLGKGEADRLDWLLRFVAWVNAAERFENYRIATRAEEAATMCLLRIIMDFSVDDAKIEQLISRFMTPCKSAPIRAKILYEESNGVIDLRRIAKSANMDKAAFETKWNQFRVKALRHFGGNVYEYSKMKDRLLREQERYAFFMDDLSSMLNADSSRWDDKLHKTICVYRSRAMFLNPLIEVFRFRQLVGKFPDVKVSSGAPEYETYLNWYDREYEWVFRQHGLCPVAAAVYYLKFKHNSYTDAQTWEMIGEAEQKEIVRTNMLTGPL